MMVGDEGDRNEGGVEKGEDGEGCHRGDVEGRSRFILQAMHDEDEGEGQDKGHKGDGMGKHVVAGADGKAKGEKGCDNDQ